MLHASPLRSFEVEPMMKEPLFLPYSFGESEKKQLHHDGHLLFPRLLTPSAHGQLIASLGHNLEAPASEEHLPVRYAAEHEPYLAEVIAHPQMLELARAVLGEEIRYDHCVNLSRKGGNRGEGWHTHPYASDCPELGLIRIFFYVSGYHRGNGSLKVVPGSHLFRADVRSESDEQLRASWLDGKTHPLTGEPLEIVDLEVPENSVIVMWTDALHAGTPRRSDSDTRWTLVTAYRNPGAPSGARWVRPEFETNPPAGAESIMSLN
jgi:hypothetical protein